ncbi:MAG: lysine--tRNA ligase [Candidatus Berkelbacteria bacterium]|nr:lysine--tRNA ligase [Candidatus Berkelbacteria bacterium]
MFWVDEIVKDILDKVKKDTFLITDWMTPSGHAHIGSLRGLILHDLIRRGLEDEKKGAIFQFGFDDFDPMDGLPIYVDQSFKKYMGMPLYHVPAPDGKSKSFADQYLNEVKEIVHGLGMKVKFVRDSELHKEGKYDEAIKIVLDNAKIIRKIYLEVSGSDKGSDWFPLQVVCPKCGKIGTTKVTTWNGEEVEFECKENLVEWAVGCGEKGKISPFGGNAKMPWKVAWGARWFVFGTDIEGEGKDHFAAGGSRDIANRIYRDVFKKEPPYDIHYEHILIAGKKMSKSKGSGVTAKDIYDFLPANILRFLFVRTKAKRTIDFQPEGDTIPLLYDEYDRCAQEYRNDPKSDLGRAFYYSELDPNKEQPKYLLRFSKVAHLANKGFRSSPEEYAKEEKGVDLTKAELEEVENRVNIASKWLDEFAPESYKFSIAGNFIPEAAKNLSAEQKEFLKKIAEVIENESLSGEDLHHKIHDVKNEMKINPKEAFSAIYLTFIGKDSGPQAGWLLASLDKSFVIKRLKEVIQ